MEAINHESYVSLEVAKLLKETGFDWEIKTFYFNNELGETMLGEAKNHNLSEQFISAPTLAVAQRWLREKHTFDINVLTDFDSVKRFYYVRYVCLDGHFRTYYITENQSYVYFNTYDEALEAGIQEGLKFLLEE